MLVVVPDGCRVVEYHRRLVADSGAASKARVTYFCLRLERFDW